MNVFNFLLSFISTLKYVLLQIESPRKLCENEDIFSNKKIAKIETMV